MTYEERMTQIGEEADLDPKLLAHVLNCDEPFCQQMRKLLNYAASLRMNTVPLSGPGQGQESYYQERHD